MADGLALFLVGLQLLGLAHFALERHGVCWEHGTVTELGRAERVASVPEALDADVGLHAGQSASQLEDQDDHHCPVQASRRHWGAPPAHAAPALPSVAASGVRPLSAAARRPDAAILLRAPKQSPPPTA
ncbi:MAG: hypothetical protein ACLQDQ_04920 [Myxococcaceae bacterium]